MPPSRVAYLFAALCASDASRAQESVAHSWSFIEVIAGTNTPVPLPNGVIDPGEAARISLTISFSPPVGSTASYTPPPPPGTGTIAGFGSCFVDLLPTGGAAGSWAYLTRAPGWALGGAGSPQANGAMIAIQAGQFVLPGQTANPENPILGIWRGVWTPNVYTERTVNYNSAASGQGFPSSILIQYGIDPQTGHPQYVAKFVSSLYGHMSIPIVPAPNSVPATLLAAAALTRRQRPRPSCPPQSRTERLREHKPYG